MCCHMGGLIWPKYKAIKKISEKFEKVQRLYEVIRKPSVQKICLRTLQGQSYGPLKFKQTFFPFFPLWGVADTIYRMHKIE